MLNQLRTAFRQWTVRNAIVKNSRLTTMQKMEALTDYRRRLDIAKDPDYVRWD